MAGEFEIPKDKAGKFRFRLKAGTENDRRIGGVRKQGHGEMGGVRKTVNVLITGGGTG